jgi:hypothetical protein
MRHHEKKQQIRKLEMIHTDKIVQRNGAFKTPVFMLHMGNEVKLSMYSIIKALCFEDIWGSGGVAPSFLASALNGG